MPERFDLSYTDKDGKKKTPVMIHRALVGSPDRFMAILTEHYSGNFPLWLSPLQVAIVPVKPEHEESAAKLANELRGAGIRIEIFSGKDSLGKRIHAAKAMRAPYVIVLGDKEVSSGNLTIETRTGEKLQMSSEEFLVKLQTEIKNRK